LSKAAAHIKKLLAILDTLKHFSVLGRLADTLIEESEEPDARIWKL